MKACRDAAAGARERSDGLLERIQAAVGEFVDPAKRIACGARLYLHTAQADPQLAACIAAAGLACAAPGSRLYDYLPADIADGIRTGRFLNLHMDIALDLVAGTTLAAVVRISRREAWPGHPEQAAATILRGLGVPAMQAGRLVRIELPRLASARTRRPEGP